MLGPSANWTSTFHTSEVTCVYVEGTLGLATDCVVKLPGTLTGLTESADMAGSDAVVLAGGTSVFPSGSESLVGTEVKSELGKWGKKDGEGSHCRADGKLAKLEALKGH